MALDKIIVTGFDAVSGAPKSVELLSLNGAARMSRVDIPVANDAAIAALAATNVLGGGEVFVLPNGVRKRWTGQEAVPEGEEEGTGRFFHQRTFYNLTNTRKRITFPKEARITRLSGLIVPHTASLPSDAGLLMVVNAATTAAADQLLNGGVLTDSLNTHQPLFLLEVNKFIERVRFGTYDNPVVTLDIVAYRGATTAGGVALSGVIGGQ